ncbi:hypothetical protein [Methylobacter luteus]|uniref:hypothetical protein n=1 Tax=Methylobacter luteus TaxID=415 RepID=UPI0003FB7EA2|nr:hypothetical protein [Methylobacter luteus]
MTTILTQGVSQQTPADDLIISLTDSGLASVDRIRWGAFHEGADLKHQIEAYKARHGVYPESVHADPLYGTRENRAFPKDRHSLCQKTAGTAPAYSSSPTT